MTTLYINCYHVKDTHGNVDFDTAAETSDNVYIAVQDAKEQYNLIYDDDAKHLRDWCKDHNLQLRHSILEVEVENPFDLE